MKLTPEHRDALAEVVRSLDEEISKLQARRDAVREWLDGPGEIEATGPSASGGTIPAASSLAGKSLRDAIKVVVAEIPDLSPVQVAQALEARGYSDKAKTDLKRRVGKEMWELARGGVLEKKGRGTYRLAKGEKNDETKSKAP